MKENLRQYLEECHLIYNTPAFIENDPIAVPHRFTALQDIEIIAFWTAILAWGQRQTIIAKSHEITRRMEGAPYDYILHHTEMDRQKWLDFRHRTFQPVDALYFLAFLQEYYRREKSLEKAFCQYLHPGDKTVENALSGFHRLFFSLTEAPTRTRKHIATPINGATCKRLNMFLRWMVRRDDRGVDFGLWRRISPAQLLMPLDVHVERVARHLGLLQRPQCDWKAVLELTARLREFDPEDPVKYDFALFGLGVLEYRDFGRKNRRT